MDEWMAKRTEPSPQLAVGAGETEPFQFTLSAARAEPSIQRSTFNVQPSTFNIQFEPKLKLQEA